MYIWRVKKLVEEFKAGTVTDRQQLPYLLVFVGLSYLASDAYISGVLSPKVLNGLDILMLPLALFLGLAGTVWCYSATRRYEVEGGFIARYICLGIPVFVRIVATVFALMLVAYFISDYVVTIPIINQHLESDETEILDVVVICVMELVAFWWLRQAIRSSYENAKQP